MNPAPARMVAAWSRGRPLVERLHTPLVLPDDPAADDTAARRLDRWRRQAPFDDPALWQARLRMDGIDEATLRRLLAEPAESLTRRLGPPEWPDEVVPPVPGTSPPAPIPVAADENHLFFARAARPLIDTAYARLRDVLAETAATRPGILSPEQLLDQLFPTLLQRVHAMLARTLTLELHLARLAGALPDDPEKRFEAFLDQLDDSRRRERLFTDYPVLGRQLWLAARQWVDAGAMLARRVVTGYDALCRRFADGAPIGKLDRVDIGMGDRHQGGQSVATLAFDSGLRLVYKPRTMAADEHFAALLDWLNRAGLSLPLRAPVCLDRGDHGFAEFITAQTCDDPAGVRRFYRRQGSLLALLELLRANDMHAENLIAAGEHPVIVDLETLLQPQLPVDPAGFTAAERLATAAARASVLHVGLLPVMAWHTRHGRALDLSGLGRRPGQRTPMGIPVLTDVGTDGMRVRLERVVMEPPDHRPVPKDAELHLLDYADDLIAGYAEMHALCRRRRDDLLADDGPLARFAGDRVRVVLRSTIVYSTLLNTSFHPDVLRDGLERDRHFDFLWRRVADVPALAALVPAERSDLWRGDMPYFTCRTDDATLSDSDGQPVPGITGVSGLELVRRDLSTRDDTHLLAQLDLIRGSLATAAINSSPEVLYPPYRLPEPGDGVGSDALLAAAETVASELARRAYLADGSAQWLGLSSNAGRDWTIGPLGCDLFNGLAGVALFLAELGRLGRAPRYTQLARQAVVTICAMLDRENAAAPAGMAGLPGVVYALCRLAILLDDEALLNRAAAVTADLRGSPADDIHFDIVGGSAGTIGALRILHRMRPDGPAADLVAAAAERLRATVRRFPAGWGWLPASISEQELSDVPLAGFGHGNAGIAWALEHAAALLGDARYRELADDAVAYERTLFDPARGAWRDMRMPDGSVSICAWCHGAVGVGLARVDRPASGPAAADDRRLSDIDTALANARSDGLGVSHCLCHGDTGIIELFLAAASALDRSELVTEAGRYAAQVVRSIESDGPVCGVPLGTPTPSLMVGLAGIGYGLLRAAAPDQVPSVLLLQPGTG